MIRINDEFTQLKEVVLGRVNPNLIHFVPHEEQSLVQDIFYQTEDDLESIQKIYEQHNIMVNRPNILPKHSSPITTPNFKTQGIRNPLAPRDCFIMIGNTILETAGHRPDMVFEYLYYKKIFLENFKRGSRWVKMPLPSFDDNCMSEDEIYNNEPIIDAAQIARLGDSLLVSSRGAVNQLGITWLKQHFAEYKIIDMGEHVEGHIDAQLKMIRPGLMITPHAKENLPSCLHNWDVISVSDNTEDLLTDHVLFRDDDISNTFPSCCIVSLNENTVFVYEHFKDTYPSFIKNLEKHKVDVIFVPFKHQHWFNQGLTCMTLELHRQGGLEKYI